jgi:hypothetical protein
MRLMRVNFKPVVERIFAIDKEIRYVAVVDRQYNLLESKMREGVTTLTSEEIDRNFYSIVPPIITDGVSRLEPYYGSVITIGIRYEKVVAIYCPIQDYVFALTLNPDVETPLLDKIANSLKTIIQVQEKQ